MDRRQIRFKYPFTGILIFLFPPFFAGIQCYPRVVLFMTKKPLSLSIVIPVYNEERYIGTCLKAISKQSVKPDEVIVVNNNSTDNTLKIIKKFSFVTILHEKRQHQAFAQKTGFDKASGDIIGRIDADSVLPKNWVEKIKKDFEQNPKIVAVTGEPDPYDIYLKKTGVFIFNFYNSLASRIAGVRMIWGANCAIRKSAWLKISNNVMQRPDVWEDFDLAFCLKRLGKIKQDKRLKVKTSFRAVHNSLFGKVMFHVRSIRTFYLRAGVIKTLLFVISRITIVLVGLIVIFDLYILQPIMRRRGHKFEVPK
jgi:glycosyltransferase involved in cell wall biosynthesis